MVALKKSGPKSKGTKLKEPSLKALLKGVLLKKVNGERDRPIRALTLDSRHVSPGSLFFAIEGSVSDGNIYISEAIARGAVAIISEKPLRAINQVTTVQVENIRHSLAIVARHFHKTPDHALKTIGITGTNGKTTTSLLCQYGLRAVGLPTGLIGTIHYDLGSRILPATRTTPQIHDTLCMLAQMIASKYQAAVLEVSSHGLESYRVHGLSFDLAVFTNLSPEHLDFHQDMEHYFAAKVKLFDDSRGAKPPLIAVINHDDPYAKALCEKLSNTTRVLTYGVQDGASFQAKNIELSTRGSAFDLEGPDFKLRVTSPLLGRFNVSNTLASLAVVWALGYDVSRAAKALVEFPGVPGRMQHVGGGEEPFTVLVDYAHTEDALSHVLSALKEITTGRLLVVFGCGGNRDSLKRPKMTTAVQRYADFAWATADNPRKESLEAIFEHMQVGVTAPERIQFVADRRKAIQQAIQAAQAGDCVLVAGRGHEAFQEFANTLIPFDDSQVVKEALETINASCRES